MPVADRGVTQRIDAADPSLMARTSILVQGALVHGQHVEVARNCQHWRTLFPDAEIVLAISTSDLLREPRSGPLPELVPARRFADDRQVTAVLDILQQCCAKIVMAEAALSLPPIKTDTPRPNNVNLQIAAAKAGLAAVTRPWLLRVRNDLIFADTSFLDQYHAGAALPRGAAATLAERVLISSTYTLNPFAYERLPFHFSDWFHLGLADDIRDLWSAPAMTLADATFFDRRLHAGAALFRERLHRTRLTVEQHLSFDPVRRHRPDVRLADAVDLSSRNLSLDYLCDNFVVCDLQAAGCVFPKYAVELRDPSRTIHCFSARDWHDLAVAAPAERPSIAMSRAAPALRPEAAPFPRVYPAASLSNPKDQGAGGTALEICAGPSTGVVSHGPYDTLPSGQYTAALHVSAIEGPGHLILRATSMSGRHVLAQIEAYIPEAGSSPPVLDFDLADPITTDVEIVVETARLAAICIVAVEIAERAGPPLILPAHSVSPKRRRIGRRLRRAWRWLRRRTIGAPPTAGASDQSRERLR